MGVNLEQWHVETKSKKPIKDDMKQKNKIKNCHDKQYNVTVYTHDHHLTKQWEDNEIKINKKIHLWAIRT